MAPRPAARWDQRSCARTRPLPGWAATLGEALFTPCYEALPGVCDPGRPIPFETLLLPFVHIYLRRVEAAAPAGRGRLSPAADHGLARHLLATLATTARDALYAEFCRYRLAGFAPLAPFVSGGPDALYRGFVGQMQAGGLLALVEAYPVLGAQACDADRPVRRGGGRIPAPARGRPARDLPAVGDGGPRAGDRGGCGAVRPASRGPPGVRASPLRTAAG